MPINGGNGVTPGHICLSCAFYQAKQCPYKNHEKSGITLFSAGQNGVCMVYKPIEEEIIMNIAFVDKTQNLIKEAERMSDSELNIALYRTIRALSEKDQKELFDYWSFLFPKDYAGDMVTNYNESKPKKPDFGKKKRKNVHNVDVMKHKERS